MARVYDVDIPRLKGYVARAIDLNERDSAALRNRGSGVSSRAHDKSIGAAIRNSVVTLGYDETFLSTSGIGKNNPRMGAILFDAIIMAYCDDLEPQR